MFIVCTRSSDTISLVKRFYDRFLGELKIEITDRMLEELSERANISIDIKKRINFSKNSR